jgi:hypothetical protein
MPSLQVQIGKLLFGKMPIHHPSSEGRTEKIAQGTHQKQPDFQKRKIQAHRQNQLKEIPYLWLNFH